MNHQNDDLLLFWTHYPDTYYSKRGTGGRGQKVFTISIEKRVIQYGGMWGREADFVD